jgi:hypothetical protein
MANENQVIKKIRCSNGHDHLIDATYLSGHTYDEIEKMVHGAIDTYVIPTSKSTNGNYSGVVNASGSTVTISKENLAGLVSESPIKVDTDYDECFNIGDVILMEATSDGTKVFDRWISAISGTGKSAIVTLAVLETQVATHHHKIGTNTNNALTTVTSQVLTAKIPEVGSAVNVVTSVTEGTFVKSVSLTDGSDDLTLTSASTGLGHTHGIDAHTHVVKITDPRTLVSQSVSAYTTLTSSNRTFHSHTSQSVAGAKSDDTAITYVTGQGSTDTFIKSLTTNSATTTSTSLTTGSNGVATTNAQTSSDEIGDIVNTQEEGAHTHSVSVTTDTNVVKSASVAPTVVTSVSLSYTSPTFAGTVVTSVPSKSVTVATSWVTASTATVVTSCDWACEVDASGVLVFDWGSSTGSAVTSATRITASQSVSVLNGKPSTFTQKAGSASIDAPNAAQSVTSGTVTATGTAASNGSHSHGFSHTHTIPTHTHSIAAHTHNYDKTVKDSSAAAIISLSSDTYTPHKHEANVDVASTMTSTSTIKVITGGSTKSVVSTLTSKETTLSVSSVDLTTDTKYYKLEGTITHPTIKSAPTGTVAVSTSSITPAKEGSEQAIKTIVFGSDEFVTDVVTNGTNTIKTSENIGGN